MIHITEINLFISILFDGTHEHIEASVVPVFWYFLNDRNIGNS